MLPLADYTAKDWSRLRPLTLAYRTAARTRQMRRYQAVPPADMAGFEAMAAKLHGQPLAISIAFNQPWVIDWQQRFIARNMHDLAYMVADNSSIPAQAAEIERLCADRDVPYVRLPGNPGTSASRSHTLALNWVYERVVKPLDPPIFAFLDHDLFPVVPVAPSRDLDGQPFYGRLVEQPKGWSLWAGYCVFDRAAIAGYELDFSQCWYRDLASGGANYERLYRHFDRSALRFAHSWYQEVPSDEAPRGSLLERHDGWLHMIDASGHGSLGTDRRPAMERLLAAIEADPEKVATWPASSRTL
ncbi:MAG: hypothetical protein KDA49_08475 [Rhodospirillaceae bacterium]|nr:hypothetical protein [Rhodospirillaceae bacterium]